MKFEFNPSPGDKEAFLEGPTEAKISVDYDDVDHTQVLLREVRKICALLNKLNKHWNKKPRKTPAQIRRSARLRAARAVEAEASLPRLATLSTYDERRARLGDTGPVGNTD